MHRFLVLTAIVTLLASAPWTASAQITLIDTSSTRAGVRVGYGGRGPDLEASIDSPLFGDAIRFRGGVGSGHWVSEFDQRPPAGTDPKVTRFAASGILFLRRHQTADYLRPYVGLGIAAYLPRGVDMNIQRGMRLIVGMEGSGDRWTVGPEVELDLPGQQGPSVADDLLLTARIGIAIRRRF